MCGSERESGEIEVVHRVNNDTFFGFGTGHHIGHSVGIRVVEEFDVSFGGHGGVGSVGGGGGVEVVFVKV